MTHDRVHILILGNSGKAVDGIQYQFKKKKSLEKEAEDSSDTIPPNTLSRYTLLLRWHLSSDPLLTKTCIMIHRT